MTTETTTAAVLIVRSLRMNEITHAEWTAELAERLAVSADNYAEEDETTIEYRGAGWRVHLHGARE